jgi:hypothetical protein
VLGIGKSVNGALPPGFAQGLTEGILGLKEQEVLRASGLEVLHIFHKYTGSTAKILLIGT